ncbi:acetyl-CoA acetyltransferase domain protein [Mycobacterium xenopi 3993]|nr:acetyl-CoA acetyltransferase domain protein [Mycobacterium xenopi 3993]
MCVQSDRDRGRRRADRVGDEPRRARRWHGIALDGPTARKRKPFTTGKEPGDYADPWFSYSHPPTSDAPALDMSITVGHNCAVQFGISRRARTSGLYAATSAQSRRLTPVLCR